MDVYEPKQVLGSFTQSWSIRVFRDDQVFYFSWFEAGACAVTPHAGAVMRFGTPERVPERVAAVAALREAGAAIVQLGVPYTGIGIFDRAEVLLSQPRWLGRCNGPRTHNYLRQATEGWR